MLSDQVLSARWMVPEPRSELFLSGTWALPTVSFTYSAGRLCCTVVRNMEWPLDVGPDFS